MIDRKKSDVELSTVRDYFESFVAVAIFFLFTITFVFQQSRIPTGSMEDTILVGDRLLVNKFIYGREAVPVLHKILPYDDIERGDIVVFKFPSRPEVDFIKRVIGKGGDVIQVKNKELSVNGEKQEEDYIKHSDERTYGRFGFVPGEIANRDNFGPFEVPENTFFVMGDNRDNSNDSRYWGVVPGGYVKGKALVILWSFETEHGVAENAGETLKRWFSYVTHFFSATRWNRILRPIE